MHELTRGFCGDTASYRSTQSRGSGSLHRGAYDLLAQTVGCPPQTVITARDRYRSHGLTGLTDAPHSGRPPAIDPELVIARTRQPPPPHLGARWSTRLLATELGISNATVAKIWQAHGIDPAGPPGSAQSESGSEFG